MSRVTASHPRCTASGNTGGPGLAQRLLLSAIPVVALVGCAGDASTLRAEVVGDFIEVTLMNGGREPLAVDADLVFGENLQVRLAPIGGAAPPRVRVIEDSFGLGMTAPMNYLGPGERVVAAVSNETMRHYYSLSGCYSLVFTYVPWGDLEGIQALEVLESRPVRWCAQGD